MTDRDDALCDLAAAVREHDAVADAWLARSFTDRLLVVDLRRDEPFPAVAVTIQHRRRTLPEGRGGGPPGAVRVTTRSDRTGSSRSSPA